jgi:magnesium chelatase accessory protein
MTSGKPRWDRDSADWPNREASEFHNAGGVNWHVQRYGRGEPLLFLHGTGASSHSWADVGSALTGDFSIIAIDLPGHGFTSTPASASMTLTGMAAAVAALLDALRVKPSIVAGHSAGAAVMIEMILSGRIAPDAALSVNGAFAPFGGAGAFLFPMMAKMLALNPFVPAMVAQGAARRERVENLIKGTGSSVPERNVDLYARLLSHSGHVAGALRMMANWNVAPLRGKLSQLKTPTVFAAGAEDRAVPPWLAEEAARLAVRGEHRLFPGLGHLAHEENPAAFAALIREIAAAH